MAPHSSTLAWKILWTEKPGRLPSMGLLRVGHDWATSLSLLTLFRHCYPDFSSILMTVTMNALSDQFPDTYSFVWNIFFCFFIFWVILEKVISAPYKGVAAAAKSLQSCPTLCNPIDSSPPGSAVPGILQTRTLEWVAISFSSAWKWKVKVKLLSRVRLLATLWMAAYQAPLSMGFSSQEYWSGVPLPSLNPNLTL